MSLAEWSGDRIEYGVRYDAPEVYAGLVGNVRDSRDVATSVKRQEEAHPGGDFKCTVVQRTVTYGEWVEVTP